MRFFLCLSLLVVLFLAAPAYGQVGQWKPVVFVPNWATDSISVVDAATNSVVRTIPLAAGTGPFSLQTSADGKKAYVVESYAGAVVVIDAMRGTVLAQIPVGYFPAGSALNSDGSKLYVTDMFGDTLSVISTATGTITKVIPLPSGTWFGSFPVGVALRPASNELWVASQVPGRIDIVSTTTDTIVATLVMADISPVGVRFSLDGKTAVVAGYSGLGLADAIRVVNATTRTTVRTYAPSTSPNVGPGVTSAVIAASGAIYATAVGPVNDTFFPVPPYTSSITRIDTAGNATRVPSGGVSPAAITLSEDARTLYVANVTSGTVGVVDTASGALLASVPVGTFPAFGGRFVLPPLPPDPGPVVATASFTANKLLVNKKKHTAEVTFVLRTGSGSNGLKPATEAVFLQLNDVWVNVPAGSFVERKKNQRWTFSGTIDGISVSFDIQLVAAETWQLSATIGPLGYVDLITNPVTATVRMGDDQGIATFTASITQ